MIFVKEDLGELISIRKFLVVVANICVESRCIYQDDLASCVECDSKVLTTNFSSCVEQDITRL